MKITILSFVVVLWTVPTVAQEESPGTSGFFEGMSFGGGIGSSWIHGDLAGYQSIPHSEAGNFFKFGWNLYAAREMYKGIGIKLHFDRGNLGGGRSVGDQSPVVTFETDFSHISLRANYNVFKALFEKEGEKKRYFIKPEIGIGYIFWRSLSNWGNGSQQVRDYEGYTVANATPATQRYTVKGKDAPSKSLTLPVGFTAGYQINYKTDVTLSYTLTNVFSDELDTWSRDFSARDKYSYLSVGLRYNLGRTKNDFPDLKKKARKKNRLKEQNREDQSFSDQKEKGVSPNPVNLKNPVSARYSNPLKLNENASTVDALKLKMFELQMKLFELKYMQEKSQKP